MDIFGFNDESPKTRLVTLLINESPSVALLGPELWKHIDCRCFGGYWAGKDRRLLTFRGNVFTVIAPHMFDII